jgi:sarcosine oxidase, subunit alpha
MLRLEKGHIIVGQDTDGLTNAYEIGANWALKMDKPYFVGQRSLRILERLARRQTLVGFTLPPAAPLLPKEGHLVFDGDAIAGRVTSIGYSPTLERGIGMALVTPQIAAGAEMSIQVERRVRIVAQITRPPFYDPQGERQRIADPLTEPACAPA